MLKTQFFCFQPLSDPILWIERDICSSSRYYTPSGWARACHNFLTLFFFFHCKRRLACLCEEENIGPSFCSPIIWAPASRRVCMYYHNYKGQNSTTAETSFVITLRDLGTVTKPARQLSMYGPVFIELIYRGLGESLWED